MRFVERIQRATLHFVFILLFAGGVAAPLSAARAGETGLDFIRQSTTERLILFVHGFTGDREKSWTHDRKGAFWPALLAEDPVFATADIATYGYPSDMFARNMSPGEVASNQRMQLETAREDDPYEQIVFVAHSMGGLIVRSLLLDHRDFINVPMIHFIAVPGTGSEIATWASKISDNRQVEYLRDLERNGFLQTQMRQWLASDYKDAVRSYCAYETVKYRGVLVVKQSSAAALCNQRLDPIPENHVRIAQPADTSADIYVAFKVAYQQTFKRLEIVRTKKSLTIASQADLDAALAASPGALVADDLRVTGSVTMPDGTLLAANTVALDAGVSVRGRDFAVVAASVRGDGSLFDLRGNAGQNGGRLLLAAGRISGIRVQADGGDGLKGDNGVNGLDGRDGRPGKDGRCDGFGKFESPRAGTDGNDGENGSDGIDGGNGGNGGAVFIVTMGTTPMVSVDAGAGGAGGLAGAGGSGGRGGTGGRGCVGLGGTKPNAADGKAGRTGQNGRPGVDGVDGADGEVGVRPTGSFETIAEHVPDAESLPDYADIVKAKLISAARQSD